MKSGVPGVASVGRASALSAADGLVRATFGFVVSIVLARLLPPADFGIVVLALAFTTVASVLIDFGLSTTLIRLSDASLLDESTVFYFTVGLSTVVAGAIAIGAPIAADFFGQPDLTGIIRLISVGLVFTALGSIHTTLLTKRLDFIRLLFVGAVSTGVAGVIAIMLALRGHGPWSLAWQVVAQALISTALLWGWHRWRPSQFNMESLRKLVSSGRPLMASGLIDVAYSQAYSVFIGRNFTTTDLGLYNRAQTMQQLPAGLLANVVQRVALPAYSRYASEPHKLARNLSQSLRLVMFFNLPLMAGLAAAARPMIELLFGARWLPAAPLFQIMCIIGAIWPLHVLNLTALLAQGQSRRYLRLELVKKVIGIGMLVATIPHGLVAVVWGQAVVGVIAFFVNSAHSGRALAFGSLAQLKDLLPEIVAAIVMAAAIALLSSRLTWSPAAKLACLASVGAGIFVVVIAAVAPSRLRDLAHQLKAATS